MKKNFKSLFLALALVMGLAVGCTSGEETEAPAKDVTEATTETTEATEKTTESEEASEETVAEVDFTGKTLNVIATSDKYVTLFDKFTEETGAKVEFLSQSSGEVLAQIEASGESVADLWFGGGLDAFIAADEKGYLHHYQSPNAEAVDPSYKAENGSWIAKGITVAGFLANNDLLEELGLEAPKTWKDLADPKYQGEVIMSDPAVSGTNYAVVKGILDMFGEEEGWTYLEALNSNIEFYGKRGKDPEEKVTAGEFALGIIPVDKGAFDVAEDNNLTVIYPEDGIPWVPEGVAIFKETENTDVAEAFVDFMLLPENQEIIAELDGKDSAQLVVPGVKGFDLGLPEDKLIDQDLTTFGSMRDEILEKFANFTQGKELQ